MTVPAIANVLARISQIEAQFALRPQALTVGRRDDRMPTFETTFQTASSAAEQNGAADDAPATTPLDHHHHDHGPTVLSDLASASTVPVFGGPAATLITPSPTSGALASIVGIPADVPYASEFAAAGHRHGVPGGLLAAVGWVESRYQPEVVSPAGAIGLMQLMPFVAEDLGVDPRDPVAAIDGAARVLKAHYERFGTWDLALAAYHAGAGAVSRAGNTAPTPRTAQYVHNVNERMSRP